MPQNQSFADSEMAEDAALSLPVSSEEPALALSCSQEEAMMVQLFVKTAFRSGSISLQANPNETLSSICNRIYAQLHISPTAVGHWLLYNGKRLPAYQTLAECRVAKDATLHLLPRLCNSTFPDINQITHVSMPPNQSFADSEMVEDAALSLPGSEEPAIALSCPQEEAMMIQLFVKTAFRSGSISLQANPNETLSSICNRIYAQLHISSTAVGHWLLYNGKRLPADQTLVECQVTKDATLHLLPRLYNTTFPDINQTNCVSMPPNQSFADSKKVKDTTLSLPGSEEPAPAPSCAQEEATMIQLFVKTAFQSGSISLQANPNETISSICNRIYTQLHISLTAVGYWLLYNGKQLPEDQTLAECQVAKDATLHLLPRLCNTTFPDINQTTHVSMALNQSFTDSEMVKDAKLSLPGSEEPAPAPSCAQEEATKIQLFVKTAFQSGSISLRANPNATISSMCNRIYTRLHISPTAVGHWLLYNGKPLPEDQTLAECQVAKDATLHLLPRLCNTTFPDINQTTHVSMPLNQSFTDSEMAKDAAPSLPGSEEPAPASSCAQEEATMIQLFVKTAFRSGSISLQANPNETLSSICNRICIQLHISTTAVGHWLLYNGKRLRADQTLAECRVAKDGTLYLLPRLYNTTFPDINQTNRVSMPPNQSFADSEKVKDTTLSLPGSEEPAPAPSCAQEEATMIQLFVKTAFRSGSISLQANPNQTISSICNRIYTQLHISLTAVGYWLLYNGKQLPEDQTLAECQVAKDATLHLLPRLCNTTFPDVNQTTHVSMALNQSFTDIEMVKDATLSLPGSEEPAPAPSCAQEEATKIQLFVKTAFQSGSISLRANPNATISSMCNRIYTRLHISPTAVGHWLLYNGKRLPEDQTLAECQVAKDATLHLLPRLCNTTFPDINQTTHVSMPLNQSFTDSEMAKDAAPSLPGSEEPAPASSCAQEEATMIQLFVKTTFRSGSISLQANPNETLSSICNRICIQLHISTTAVGHWLLYNGKRLRADQTLAECRVAKDGTLYLLPRLYNTTFPDINQTNRVSMPPNQSFADSEKVKDTTLSLPGSEEPAPAPSCAQEEATMIQLFVKTAFRSGSISLQANPNETISSICNRIYTQLHISLTAVGYWLLYNGKQLPEDQTLAECQVAKDATLHLLPRLCNTTFPDVNQTTHVSMALNQSFTDIEMVKDATLSLPGSEEPAPAPSCAQEEATKIQLFVKTAFQSGSISLQANPNETISSMCNRIYTRLHISPTAVGHWLLYNGKRLPEDQTLAECQVAKDATLHLLPRLCNTTFPDINQTTHVSMPLNQSFTDSEMAKDAAPSLPGSEEPAPASSCAQEEATMIQLFVKTTFRSGSISLQANPNETLSSICNRICIQLHISTTAVGHWLLYNGKRLRADQTLAECRVAKDGTLYLLPRLYNTTFPDINQTNRVSMPPNQSFADSEKVKDTTLSLPGSEEPAPAPSCAQEEATMIQLFVKTAFRSGSISLQANPNQTISSICNRIYTQLHISLTAVGYWLLYNGKQLPEDQTLAECQVAKDATLHLLPRLCNTTFPDVNQTTHVSMALNQSFTDIEMVKDATLSLPGSEEPAPAPSCAQEEATKIQLFVKTAFQSGSISLQANPNETISSMCNRIYTRLHISPTAVGHWLLYNGKRLPEDQTLAECQVAKDATLHLLPRLCNTTFPDINQTTHVSMPLNQSFTDSEMAKDAAPSLPGSEEPAPASSCAQEEATMIQLFVKTTFRSGSISLQANPNETISSICNRICIQLHISTTAVGHWLLYNGKRLRADQTLAECRVAKDGTLYLLPRLYNTTFPDINQTNRVSMPPNQSFADSEKVKDTTLSLPGSEEPAPAPSCAQEEATMIQLFVKTAFRSGSISLQANPHETISSICNRIYTQLHISLTAVGYWLLYNGKQLPEDQTLAECQVAKDATLHLLPRLCNTTFPDVNQTTHVSMALNQSFTDIEMVKDATLSLPGSEEPAPAPSCAQEEATKIQLFVKTAFQSGSISLQANPNETISSMCNRIYTRLHISPTAVGHWLLYNGKRLPEDQTLAECQVAKDATLHLLPRLCNTTFPDINQTTHVSMPLNQSFTDSEMAKDAAPSLPGSEEPAPASSCAQEEATMIQLFVKTTFRSGSISLQANPNEMLSSICNRICIQLHISTTAVGHWLLYNGKRLRADQTLAECRVAKDGTLYLLPRLYNTTFPDINQTNCVSMPPNQSFAESEMVEDATLDLPVTEEPALTRSCVKEEPTKIQLFVKTAFQSGSISLQANPSDTHQSICDHVCNRLHMSLTSTVGHWFLYNGKPLPADQTLAESGVVKDATLQLVPRMPSTPLSNSWKLAIELVNVCEEIDRVSSLQLISGRDRRQSIWCQKRVEELVITFLKKVLEPIPVCQHVEIFCQAGIAKALVMLYRSSVTSNVTCATRCIDILFTGEKEGSEEVLPKHDLAFIIPVLLQLCKHIENVVPDSIKYRMLLASLLDNYGNVYLEHEDASKIVCDIAPIVHHISFRIHQNWANYSESEEHRPSDCFNSDSKSFVSFLIPLCEALHRRESCGFTVEMGSPRWLKGIFDKHLQDLNCYLFFLGKVESLDKGLPFLNVIKALYVMARLCPGGMAGLHSLFASQALPLNLLVRQLQFKEGDYTWLIEFKSYLQSDIRKDLAFSLLPVGNYTRHRISVHRSTLLHDSFESLAYVEPEKLQGGISVEFVMEEATGPGVLREWFSLICREIFNPATALFKSCPNDTRRVFPNPNSGVNPGHLTYFRFCGRVIALALMHKIEIDTILDLTFFNQLAGLPVSWTDTQDADPELHKNWGKLLEMDAEYIDSDSLALTFVAEAEKFGIHKTVELCPGGEDVKVNSKNRLQFVDLLARSAFVTPIVEQVKSFCQGFSDLLRCGSYYHFFQILQLDEFDLMLYGKDRDIPVEDWKAHTKYHGYKARDKQIIWFWKTVSEMSMEQRRKLLHFSTSLSHLPVGSFVALPSRFHIYQSSSESNHFPTAHTCFYQLILPRYPTFKIMHDRLHAVIEDHVSVGFGFI